MSPIAAGSVITTGLALLAFLIAFYVLLARERKIPYITNFVFPPAGLLIGAIFFSFVGQLSQPRLQPPQDSTSLLSSMRGIISTAATWLAISCLAAGMVVTLLHIWRL